MTGNRISRRRRRLARPLRLSDFCPHTSETFIMFQMVKHTIPPIYNTIIALAKDTSIAVSSPCRKASVPVILS